MHTWRFSVSVEPCTHCQEGVGTPVPHLAAFLTPLVFLLPSEKLTESVYLVKLFFVQLHFDYSWVLKSFSQRA